MYKIKKCLNNNVAQVVNENGQSLIIFGKGIAYNKKEGSIIQDADITEKYFIGKENLSYFSEILENISPQIIDISEQIAKRASQTLDCQFNATLLLMLADHISFAIERVKQNIVLVNPLQYEVNRLYTREVAVGIEAIEMIKQTLEIQLPDEEATMLAMHFVNCQIGTNIMEESVLITTITSEILNMINFHLQTIVSEDTPEMTRFLIHLRYFILKQIKNEAKKEDLDNEMYELVVTTYQKSYECSKKIQNYLVTHYDYHISNNEIVYLILHLNRLISNNQEEKS